MKDLRLVDTHLTSVLGLVLVDQIHQEEPATQSGHC